MHEQRPARHDGARRTTPHACTHRTSRRAARRDGRRRGCMAPAAAAARGAGGRAASARCDSRRRRRLRARAAMRGGGGGGGGGGARCMRCMHAWLRMHAWHPCMQHTSVRTGPAYTVRTAVGVVVQLYAYTGVRTYCGLYGEGRSAGVATLLVEVSLGRYRTATHDQAVRLL
jgi:hypothetical protein